MQNRQNRLQKFGDRRSFGCWFTTWALHREGEGDWKTRRTLQTGGCRTADKGTDSCSCTGLALWASTRWVSRSLRLPTSLAEVYVEALTAFRHKSHPDSLRRTLQSLGCDLEQFPLWGRGAELTFLGQRRGWGASEGLCAAGGSTGCPVSSVPSSNTPPSMTGSYDINSRLWSVLCPEQSGGASTSMGVACLTASWLHQRHIPEQS